MPLHSRLRRLSQVKAALDRLADSGGDRALKEFLGSVGKHMAVLEKHAAADPQASGP